MGAEGPREAVPTRCDRSRIEALIGESLPSSAEPVMRVASIDFTVASWVVTVSSCLVMDARALREAHRNGIRMVSPSVRSLCCLSLGRGICSEETRSLSRVS